MIYFKAKRHRNSNYKNIILKISIILIILVACFFLSKIKITNNLINYSLFNMGTNYQKEFFKYSFLYEKEINSVPIIKEVSDKPIVYIYNTHQSESYKLANNDTYNIKPTVMTVSYMLQELLSSYNIEAIVEEQNIAKILDEENLNYNDSYEVSRKLLVNAKKKYPSLEYFIDIHRDSSVYSKTIAENNNIKYAKLLFVIGKDHDNYLLNLENTKVLQSYFNTNYSYLIRGIYQKSGSNVNGIYNQDYSPNTFLVEVGGVDNYLDECYNTMSIFAKLFTKYIGDSYEKEE